MGQINVYNYTIHLGILSISRTDLVVGSTNIAWRSNRSELHFAMQGCRSQVAGGAVFGRAVNPI
jgi:hypothetical protein